LAAAVAGQTLLGDEKTKSNWAATGKWFRLIWTSVLGLGVLVALLDLDIIPVILAAQVVNGFLLPFLAAMILYLANDRLLLGNHINRIWQNAVGIAAFVFLTYQSCTKLSQLITGKLLPELAILVALLTGGILLFAILKQRKTPAENH